MKIQLQIYIILLISLAIFYGCGEEEEPMNEINNQTIQADFQAIDLSPGIKDVSIEVAEGVFYNFRAIIPDVDFTEDWPLIMAFHGASNGDPNAHKTTGCYLEPGFAAMDAFIIHPNAGSNEWYEGVNQTKIQTLLSLATSFWPIDFTKIAATGYSNGGNASWLLAEIAPNVFSASIPIASSYDLSTSDSTSRKIDIPMYVIHGENDELFPIEITKKWVDESNAAGSNITFVEAQGLTHFKPCEYVPYVQDAVVWLGNLWK